MRTADRVRASSIARASPLDVYASRRRDALYTWFAGASVSRGLVRVLDAGCGDGAGSAILAAAGLNVVAIDRDIATLAIAARTHQSRRVEFRRGDATRTIEPDGAFDGVISPCLVEHVADPHALVAEAARLVRDGGLVAVATPNRLTASPGRTLPVDPHHLWEFTPGELVALVRRYVPAVRMYGSFHGPKLRAAEIASGQSIARAATRLAPADRAWWLRTLLTSVRPGDFLIGPGDLRRALDLVAVGIP